jgi:hypothetical protein
MYWGEPITVAAVLHIADAALSVCADGGKGEAVYQYRPWEGNTWHDCDEKAFSAMPEKLRRIVYAAPQAECAPRAEDPDWMGKLPKCNEWPSGVAPRAEPVEESDVRPKERLCGGSHISCNGVDYCLGHPSCRDIAKERAKKEQK